MKTLFAIVGFAVICAAVFFAWFQLSGQRDIQQLLTENKELQTAINNLSSESQIGYAKVVEQYTIGGTFYTKLLFVETDPENPRNRIFEKEFEIEGDIAHFDTLIIKFDTPIVMEGKERAIYLWRRIYSDKMLPEDGIQIETHGAEPSRYQQICQNLSIKDKNMFWQEIWSLANDTEKLKHLGIKAVYGSVVYEKMEPGLIYIFKIAPTGNFYPEVIPDL